MSPYSTEDIERERQLVEHHPWLSTEIGYGGRTRRQRPEVPDECWNEVFLELLALLGLDLGEEGEMILRRVARDAPWLLAPALEEQLTGFALARYGRGLLVGVPPPCGTCIRISNGVRALKSEWRAPDTAFPSQ